MIWVCFEKSRKEKRCFQRFFSADRQWASPLARNGKVAAIAEDAIAAAASDLLDAVSATPSRKNYNHASHTLFSRTSCMGR
jgi:hypothetical protein